MHDLFIYPTVERYKCIPTTNLKFANWFVGTTWTHAITGRVGRTCPNTCGFLILDLKVDNSQISVKFSMMPIQPQRSEEIDHGYILKKVPKNFSERSMD